MPPKKPRPSDAEIILKCPTCKQGFWWHGQHVCKRKTCKYLQPSKASSVFVEHPGRRGQ